MNASFYHHLQYAISWAEYCKECGVDIDYDGLVLHHRHYPNHHHGSQHIACSTVAPNMYVDGEPNQNIILSYDAVLMVVLVVMMTMTMMMMTTMMMVMMMMVMMTAMPSSSSTLKISCIFNSTLKRPLLHA